MLPAMLLLASCGSKKAMIEPSGFESGNVRHMQTGITDADLFYSLPRTVVSIDVEIRKTEHIPGPYARFANRFLGLDNVIMSASETYEIKNIKINSFAEPDPDQLYYLRLPDTVSRNTFLNLSEAGLIAGISSTPGFDAQKDSYQYTKDFGAEKSRFGFNYFMDINLMERIDTIIQYIFEDTAVVQHQTYRRSMVEKTTEQRAREVAEHILEIREKKFDLISGFQEIPYSKDALEFMHAEMSKLENDYLKLFTGVTTQGSMRYRFIHRPTIEDVGKKHNLFYFSANEGVIAAVVDDESTLYGRPLTLMYKAANATDFLKQHLQQSFQNTLPAGKGIHYRIPEYADIDVLLADEPRAKSRMLINQFGAVNALPIRNMEIDFYPDTGSIKSIGLEKTEEKKEE